MEVKRKGDIEYYVTRFRNMKTGERQYGLHARNAITKDYIIAAVYLGLFDTPEQAEEAWLEYMKKQGWE